MVAFKNAWEMQFGDCSRRSSHGIEIEQIALDVWIIEQRFFPFFFSQLEELVEMIWNYDLLKPTKQTPAKTRETTA